MAWILASRFSPGSDSDVALGSALAYRSPTASKTSPYSYGAPTARITRVSQSISIASLRRRDIHQSAAFHGKRIVVSAAKTSTRESPARMCSSSCRRSSSRVDRSASRAHAGTTIRGRRNPNTAGPASCDTRTRHMPASISGHSALARRNPTNARTKTTNKPRDQATHMGTIHGSMRREIVGPAATIL